MLELETEVNKLIKGKKFVNNNGDDVSGRFYFRNDTKLKLSRDKKKDTKVIKTTGIKVVQTK